MRPLTDTDLEGLAALYRSLAAGRDLESWNTLDEQARAPYREHARRLAEHVAEVLACKSGAGREGRVPGPLLDALSVAVVLRAALSRLDPEAEVANRGTTDPQELAGAVMMAARERSYADEQNEGLRARVTQLERQATATRETMAELAVQLEAARRLADAAGKG